MSDSPKCLTNLSISLSEVLDEIGINEEIIALRRECAQLYESLWTFVHCVNARISLCYNFGSQSEGSTTPGMKSDVDVLFYPRNSLVISDINDWKPEVTKYLMVQDERTAPGHCLLQLLKDDEPRPADDIPVGMHHWFFQDIDKKVWNKNTVQHILDFDRHGPALTPAESNKHESEHDVVFARRCLRWPKDGRQWLTRENVGGWPTEQIKTEAKQSGCFVVPVASPGNGEDELEWRISTSLAERYLMFSLSVPQMKCYVLIKILLKTFDVFHDVISSYMVKTVLFYCIEQTKPEFWKNSNLLGNIHFVLNKLYKCIEDGDCPHFIIPENNLMAGKISRTQQQKLLEFIPRFINSEGQMLFEIKIDTFGERLRVKCDKITDDACAQPFSADMRRRIAIQLFHETARNIHEVLITLISFSDDLNIESTIQHFKVCYEQSMKQSRLSSRYSDAKALTRLSSLLSSTLGSVIASNHLLTDIQLPAEVYRYVEHGVDSDVTSGWLKLATVCYSAGDIDRAEHALNHVEQHYDKKTVLPVCGCHCKKPFFIRRRFNLSVDRIPAENIQNVAYCVCFMRSELNIIPKELTQICFHASQKDIEDSENYCINLALMDFLPYLHFLQYKIYKCLGDRERHERALCKLKQVIDDEQGLFHKEEALNVLGQCMEQENCPDIAFDCYKRSLEIRPDHNAAKRLMTR